MDLHRFELPERFNRLESMLFAAQPRQAQIVAERYVGHLLSRPVAPPPLVVAPRIAELSMPRLDSDALQPRP